MPAIADDSLINNTFVKILIVIEIGKYNTLEILRHTSVGLYLGDETGEDVLLPNKYCPEEYEIGGKITVFVYRDYEERKIATNITPGILLHEFAFLKVNDVSPVGAFLDWGLEKDLLVPFKEQRQKMEVGRWYVVYMDIDEKTYRLYASNKPDKYLSNDQLTVEQGQEVDLLVMKRTDLGFSVIVNNKHKGLVYHSDVFSALNIGEKLKGYVKEIREDNKLDITLQPIGFEAARDAHTARVMELLTANDGIIELSDKSSPEEIYAIAAMSKKAFKKSLGNLYREGRVKLEKDKTILIK